MEKGNSCFKLCPFAFGVAMGILWSLSLVVTALLSMCCGDWGSGFINVMASVYVGYGASLTGIGAGLLWGLLDGFIGGFIFAWLYNRVLGCGCSKCLCYKCKCSSNNCSSTK